MDDGRMKYEATERGETRFFSDVAALLGHYHAQAFEQARCIKVVVRHCPCGYWEHLAEITVYEPLGVGPVR